MIQQAGAMKLVLQPWFPNATLNDKSQTTSLLRLWAASEDFVARPRKGDFDRSCRALILVKPLWAAGSKKWNNNNRSQPTPSEGVSKEFKCCSTQQLMPNGFLYCLSYTGEIMSSPPTPPAHKTFIIPRPELLSESKAGHFSARLQLLLQSLKTSKLQSAVNVDLEKNLLPLLNSKSLC